MKTGIQPDVHVAWKIPGKHSGGGILNINDGMRLTQIKLIYLNKPFLRFF